MAKLENTDNIRGVSQVAGEEISRNLMLEQSCLYLPLISSLLDPQGAAPEYFGAIAWCSGLEQGGGGQGSGWLCLV